MAILRCVRVSLLRSTQEGHLSINIEIKSKMQGYPIGVSKEMTTVYCGTVEAKKLKKGEFHISKVQCSLF